MNLRVGALLAAAGCGSSLHGRDCAAEPPVPGETTACEVDGRAYLVSVPDGAGPFPVVVYFHGGGGSAEGANASTAASGDDADPGTLSAVAASRGVVVVYPEGTPSRLLRKLHTWNAGGGEGELQCVSGRACADGVDDVAFTAALLDDLGAHTDIDAARVYATGISNGGAMTYRLAHELPERFAAIAPVASADQLGAAGGLVPTIGMPILHVHGTDDPCWAFDGGASACLQDDGLAKASVDDTLARWRVANGCADGDPAVEPFPGASEDDGTSTTRESFPGCSAELVLMRIEGGGHTWPDGRQYLSEERVGRVERDWPGNEVLLDFFLAHARGD